LPVALPLVARCGWITCALRFWSTVIPARSFLVGHHSVLHRVSYRYTRCVYAHLADSVCLRHRYLCATPFCCLWITAVYVLILLFGLPAFTFYSMVTYLHYRCDMRIRPVTCSTPVTQPITTFLHGYALHLHITDYRLLALLITFYIAGFIPLLRYHRSPHRFTDVYLPPPLIRCRTATHCRSLPPAHLPCGYLPAC